MMFFTQFLSCIYKVSIIVLVDFTEELSSDGTINGARVNDNSPLARKKPFHRIDFDEM